MKQHAEVGVDAVSQPKKRRQTFADIVREVREEPSLHGIPVETAWQLDGSLLDPEGVRWEPHRGPLDRRIVDRLIKRGTVRVMVDRVGGSDQAWLSPAEGRQVWESRLRDRYYGPGGEVKGQPWPVQPVYDAVEFVDADERRLICFREYC